MSCSHYPCTAAAPCASPEAESAIARAAPWGGPHEPTAAAGRAGPAGPLLPAARMANPLHMAELLPAPVHRGREARYEGSDRRAAGAGLEAPATPGRSMPRPA